MESSERFGKNMGNNQRSPYQDFVWIGGGFILVLLGVGLGAWFFGGNQAQLDDNMLGYFANVFTESMSITLTVLVLDRINQWRDSQATKKRLVREAGSRSSTVATAAIEWLRAENWLTGKDSLLQGAHLWTANLTDSDLQGANLSGAYLRDANLTGASLQQADLQGANLRRAILTGAQLGDARLQDADLRLADFTNAVLLRANLQNTKLDHASFAGASLHNASLVGAELGAVVFDEKTVLPDAKTTGRDKNSNLIFTKYWTSKTDMSRYTDPNHPDFWQPDWLSHEEEK